MASRPPQEIIDWALVMEAYGRDWDETFDNRPGYFTQEFWYLLILATIAHWRDRPMTMSQACHAMKSGSNRTREERIKRAVDDGYLVKMRDDEDGRNALVLPTARLEALIHGHLDRTLTAVKAVLLKP
jgi:hypothetical protein